MRLFSCIAFALFLAAPLTAYAAEPESPDALIGQTDAVRAAIQERLSAKFTNASEARKSEDAYVDTQPGNDAASRASTPGPSGCSCGAVMRRRVPWPCNQQGAAARDAT